MYSKARSHQLTNVNKSALASADYVNKSGATQQQQNIHENPYFFRVGTLWPPVLLSQRQSLQLLILRPTTFLPKKPGPLFSGGNLRPFKACWTLTMSAQGNSLAWPASLTPSTALQEKTSIGEANKSSFQVIH
jgi:hypothetical protein